MSWTIDANNMLLKKRVAYQARHSRWRGHVVDIDALRPEVLSTNHKSPEDGAIRICGDVHCGRR
jgi:hypothetical protein